MAIFREKRVSWPKVEPPLPAEYQEIPGDWMKHWLGRELKGIASIIVKFGHKYVVSHSGTTFVKTLEVGTGLGEHLKYEHMSKEQEDNYIAVDIRQNVADSFKQLWPNIQMLVKDCQEPLGFSEESFDRIIAIHVLEHLPNLPAFLAQAHQLLNKNDGIFIVVIPCEGGAGYWLGRKLFSQKLFEQRYHLPYKPFIKSDHLNTPEEILRELKRTFKVVHRRYYPLYLPSVHLNLCLGLALRPR